MTLEEFNEYRLKHQDTESKFLFHTDSWEFEVFINKHAEVFIDYGSREPQVMIKQEVAREPKFEDMFYVLPKSKYHFLLGDLVCIEIGEFGGLTGLFPYIQTEKGLLPSGCNNIDSDHLIPNTVDWVGLNN